MKSRKFNAKNQQIAIFCRQIQRVRWAKNRFRVYTNELCNERLCEITLNYNYENNYDCWRDIIFMISNINIENSNWFFSRSFIELKFIDKIILFSLRFFSHFFLTFEIFIFFKQRNDDFTFSQSLCLVLIHGKKNENDDVDIVKYKFFNESISIDFSLIDESMFFSQNVMLSDKWKLYVTFLFNSKKYSKWFVFFTNKNKIIIFDRDYEESTIFNHNDVDHYAICYANIQFVDDNLRKYKNLKRTYEKIVFFWKKREYCDFRKTRI